MSKVWLITGSGRGLGRAIASEVLARGDRVVATARDPRKLEDLVGVDPERVLPVALDVTDREAADRGVAAAVERFGRLDVLVNNAGYGNMAPIELVPEDDFRRQIETDLWGVINLTRAALPVMRRRRAGHIIQISSVGGRTTSAGLGPYQTSKWAVEGFSGVLAKEVAPFGLKVTVIEPGGFRTDWAGESMRVGAIPADYQPSVGQVAARLRGRVGQEVGDPDKAAQVIAELTELAEPPLQLILGSEAWQLAREADLARIASDDRYRHLSEATEFDATVVAGGR